MYRSSGDDHQSRRENHSCLAPSLSSSILEGCATRVDLGIKLGELGELLSADFGDVQVGTLEPLRKVVLSDAISPGLVGDLECSLVL